MFSRHEEINYNNCGLWGIFLHHFLLKKKDAQFSTLSIRKPPGKVRTQKTTPATAKTGSFTHPSIGSGSNPWSHDFLFPKHSQTTPLKNMRKSKWVHLPQFSGWTMFGTTTWSKMTFKSLLWNHLTDRCECFKRSFAPENRPKPNRKVVFQPFIFRGELLISERVMMLVVTIIGMGDNPNYAPHSPGCVGLH